MSECTGLYNLCITMHEGCFTKKNSLKNKKSLCEGRGKTANGTLNSAVFLLIDEFRTPAFERS